MYGDSDDVDDEAVANILEAHIVAETIVRRSFPDATSNTRSLPLNGKEQVPGQGDLLHAWRQAQHLFGRTVSA